jgi:hypothetical protein
MECFQLELLFDEDDPKKTYYKGVDFDEMYTDQAPIDTIIDNGEHRGYFGATYTPWGIKQLDSEFANRIQNLWKIDGDSSEQIRKDIIDNVHLHYYIKENLLLNLETFERIMNEKKI